MVFAFQNLICSECGDEFTLQSQLAIHMEEHRQELAGSRLHACKACRREFETSSQLKEHTKTHYKIRYEPGLGLGKKRRNVYNILKMGVLRYDCSKITSALEIAAQRLSWRAVRRAFKACSPVYGEEQKLRSLK